MVVNFSFDCAIGLAGLRDRLESFAKGNSNAFYNESTSTLVANGAAYVILGGDHTLPFRRVRFGGTFSQFEKTKDLLNVDQIRVSFVYDPMVGSFHGENALDQYSEISMRIYEGLARKFKLAEAGGLAAKMDLVQSLSDFI